LGSETVIDTESVGRKAGRPLGWGLLGDIVTRFGSLATSRAPARLLAFLLDQALLGFSAVIRLAVAGTTGLLVYVMAAIPRKELQASVSVVRSTKARPYPATG
jgi:hypothetical protein